LVSLAESDGGFDCCWTFTMRCPYQ
jgi:hypothetical protein